MGASVNCLALLVEDLRIRTDGRLVSARALRTMLFSINFQALVAARLACALYRQRILGRPLAAVLRYWLECAAGCHIDPRCSLGRRIRFAHAVGIVVGAGVVVEDGVTIYQHVTLGGSGAHDRAYPHICSGSTLYAGCVVVGAVTVGESARIGALAFANCDVPAHCSAVGNPVRIIRPTGVL